MSDGKITKTICQYSEKLDEETISFLKGIASDFSKVKNYAFQRYSGIKSIDKLVPGYDILNEMRASGLRGQLNLNVSYFQMAVFEAIWDIKAMWQNLKNKLMNLTNQSENLSADEKSYIRLVLRINSVYSAIRNDRPYKMPDKAKDLDIDVKALNNRIKRWTRKYKTTPSTDKSNTFRIAPTGFSYSVGGIRLAGRERGKRVFIPLKDATPYKRQIIVIVMEDHIKIVVPVDMEIVTPPNYYNTIFAHIGYKDMITLSNGNIYGADLRELVAPETERLINKNRERHKYYVAYTQCIENGDAEKAEKIKTNNLGNVKYNLQKDKKYAETIKFINTELNKLLRTEKPCKVVITAPIKYGKMKKFSKSSKIMLNRSFSGFIRKRLEQKCREKGIELVQINSKDTGNRCSCCGEVGIKKQLKFQCQKCGAEMSSALNSAKNIEKIFLNL